MRILVEWSYEAFRNSARLFLWLLISLTLYIGSYFVIAVSYKQYFACSKLPMIRILMSNSSAWMNNNMNYFIIGCMVQELLIDKFKLCNYPESAVWLFSWLAFIVQRVVLFHKIKYPKRALFGVVVIMGIIFHHNQQCACITFSQVNA